MADLNWITDRLAVGGGIWTRDNLEAVARAGVTHIINTQVEFDDRTLLWPDENHLTILHLPMDDDFQYKSSELLARGVEFAHRALNQPRTRVLVHCASGVHRGPLVALAILATAGFTLRDAIRLLQARRPQADFPQPYLDSVADFLAEWETERQGGKEART